MRPKGFAGDTSTVGMVLLAVLVALVGGTGVWMIGESRERVQKQILKEHSLTAHLQAELVGAEVASRLRLVGSYASRPSIIEAAERNNWGDIADQLERFVREDGDFSSAAITDARGDIRALRVSDASMVGNEAPYRNNFYRAVSEGEPFVSEASFCPAGTVVSGSCCRQGSRRRRGVSWASSRSSPT